MRRTLVSLTGVLFSLSEMLLEEDKVQKHDIVRLCRHRAASRKNVTYRRPTTTPPRRSPPTILSPLLGLPYAYLSKMATIHVSPQEMSIMYVWKSLDRRSY